MRLINKDSVVSWMKLEIKKSRTGFRTSQAKRQSEYIKRKARNGCENAEIRKPEICLQEFISVNYAYTD